MEQGGQFASRRIDARDVRALVAVAVQTAEGQILRRRQTSVLAGDDVIELNENREWTRIDAN
jgi:hypothetical protein